MTTTGKPSAPKRASRSPTTKAKKPAAPRKRRMRLEVLAAEARRTAKIIKAAGGALGVVEQTYHAGLVTGAALMAQMSEWAGSKAIAELTADQRVALMGSLPKFIAGMETLGDAMRDRRRDADAAAIPPEPPRQTAPALPVPVPVEPLVVPVEGDPVPVDGEIVPVDPRDRLFEHPEMRKIIEAGQRLMDERRTERRRARDDD